ncbi:MAG TPA: hypothetical protein DC031_06755 [Sulfitobacter sp.]|jgi:hypothetical protein|uniref:Uncharacterized protein n=1 Tax=Sulfitobacter dubius TaxID=218673 RepID=A0ABY3ZQH0_9RHOB|nr:DUF6494 family protein [Sulfitobacter dubius]UOA16880.1 hypothetical protein DSM109990_03767 [Sulfitobacter dubius]WOI30918.1 DUF6494 family protein [Sulfitobacter dubius]SFH30210.1 hypothetical protein SAMN04488039_104122 [Sulfitobacter dubius]HBB82964.1 hypothetical protein [Sulfitobacter sp.]|tara:strand:+ start:437 stop:640 length:204 start_codon:yes stop_codon:yes gene_type:complete
MSEDFNMSMRKFLKQVGVTSQQAIEKAMREGDTSGKTFPVKAVISIPELGLEHEIDGTIAGADKGEA